MSRTNKAREGVRDAMNGTSSTRTDTSAGSLQEVASLLTQAAALLSAKNDSHPPAHSQDVHEPDQLHMDTQQPASTAQPLLVGQPTGWAAVEKALTDFDRQEIGAYKEDIDSLLTFVSYATRDRHYIICKLTFSPLRCILA